MTTQRILTRSDALRIRNLAERMPELPHGDEIADTLLDLVAQARVIDDEASTSHVGLGSVVSYEVQGTAGVQTVTVVAPDEADVRAGRISIFTPVGLALLGLPEGGAGLLRLPNGHERAVRVQTAQPGLLPAA